MRSGAWPTPWSRTERANSLSFLSYFRSSCRSRANSRAVATVSADRQPVIPAGLPAGVRSVRIEVVAVHVRDWELAQHLFDRLGGGRIHERLEVVFGTEVGREVRGLDDHGCDLP